MYCSILLYLCYLQHIKDISVKKCLLSNVNLFFIHFEQKLFVVREYTIPDADGEIVNRTQTLVTSKGIEFIDKLLKEIDYDLEKFFDLEV